MPRKIIESVRRLDLCLKDAHVLTEAATGAYAVTPVIAAVAGADVIAFTKNSPHGTIQQVKNETLQLASALGVQDRIQIVTSLEDRHLGSANIVTNSGHLRPLGSNLISKMMASAVVSLMYESWELRSSDIDLPECRARGIRVAGTNERHKNVGVFDYLGLVVLKAILSQGHELIGDRCLVVSDNEFANYICDQLRAAGAIVDCVERPADAEPVFWDVVVIATTPPLAGGGVVELHGIHASLYCQLWGDVDRASTASTDGTWCPAAEPSPGHMGLTLQSLGCAPIIKLQAAGLKCGELMLRGDNDTHDLLQWVVRH